MNERQKSDKPGAPVSDFGKPLIQICIENERGDKWPLRELFKRLLLDYGCDPNTLDYSNQENMICWSARRTKTKSCEILIELFKDELNVNDVHKKEKESMFGYVMGREDFNGERIVKLINTKLSDRIDYHKPQKEWN